MFGLFKNLFASSESTEALKAHIEAGAVLVDVRTPDEFASGSVEGAVNIPLGEIAQRYKELDPEARIIVFCRSGNRSSQAKSILESKGYTKVVNGGTWEDVARAKFAR